MELTWADTLPGPLVAAVLAAAGEAGEADGTSPLSEQVLNSLHGTPPARHGVLTESDEVIGYANILGGSEAAVEALVHPSARGRGRGGRLVAAALAEAGAGAQVWAHGDLPAARAVADRLGLAVARELFQLRRLMDETPLPALLLPDSVQLRSYGGPQDDAEVLRVNNAAFAWHPEQGGWGENELALRTGASWFDPEGLLLAFDAADPTTLLGFHWTKVHPSVAGQPALGEVFVLGVDPAAQGRGLGKALTLAGLHHLHREGLRTVLLYVEADNAAALRTYTTLGFTHFHSDVAFVKK